MSLLTCWLRSDRIPLTSLALLSSAPKDWLRLLRLRDNRVTASKVGPNCGAIWLSVADNVSRDWFKVVVLVSPAYDVKSLTASVNEYGEPVREIGMTSSGCIIPLPADSTVSTRSPNSVPVRMCALVSVPSGTLPFIVNVTSASPLRNATSDTVPTLIPDTVTALPGASPPASVNSAWYRTLVPIDTIRSGDRPTRISSTIRTAPMKPALISPLPRYFNIRVPDTSSLRT